MASEATEIRETMESLGFEHAPEGYRRDLDPDVWDGSVVITAAATGRPPTRWDERLWLELWDAEGEIQGERSFPSMREFVPFVHQGLVAEAMAEGRRQARLHNQGDRVVTYTTAEEAYDGFGTQTEAIVGKTDRGKTIRKVTTPARHVNWQRMRYGSGLHMAIDETEFQKLVDYGMVTLEGNAA